MQRKRILDRAQVVHPGEVRTGNRQPARRGAGGEDGGVEGDGLAAAQLRPLAAGVEGGDRVAGQQLDGMLGVEAAFVHARGVGLLLAAQHVLGQRRPLVRVAGFLG